MPKAEASEEKLTGTRTKLSLHEPTPRRQIVLAQASLTCLEAYMEACQTPGFEGEMYWHGHDPEALRGSSRLAQEQASEGKRIGRSMISRRLEAHRGLPKKRPRKENVLARARSRTLRGSSKLDQEQASEEKRIGTSTISRPLEAHRGLLEARPRRQNAVARARHRGRGDPKLYNTIVGVPWHHG